MDDKTYTISAAYIDPESVPNIDVCGEVKAEVVRLRAQLERYKAAIEAADVLVAVYPVEEAVAEAIARYRDTRAVLADDLAVGEGTDE